jgi:predicted nucleic acid-binding Zn ribbon protein
MISEKKICPVCGAPVKGRSDKKFCSEKCKSIQQYEKRNEKEAFYLEVHKQLRTNRKILKAYNRKGFTTVLKIDLFEEGFDPNYFTHYWKNAKGDIYLFVYDYGFLDIKKTVKQKYLIVVWQEYMRKKGSHK